METNKDSGPEAEDPHPDHLPKNPLRITIKKEVVDSGYGEKEWRAYTSSAECQGRDAVPDISDKDSSSLFDPDVVAGLKVELDIAEEPATECRDLDDWKEESRHDEGDSPGSAALSLKNHPSEPDIQARAMHSNPTRSDLYASAMLTSCLRDGPIPTPTLLGESPVNVWKSDPDPDCLRRDSASVDHFLLQGLGADQEPWCVIKAEPLSESDSDAESEPVTARVPETGARAVFNRNKGGRADLEVFVGLRNGERRYCCPQAGCGKAYTRGEALKIHALAHTGHRPYLCPEPSCRKAFAHPFVLKEHAKAHTGDKPYLCQEAGCGKRFRDRSNFRKHRLFAHTAGVTPSRRRSRKPPAKPEKKPHLCPETGCGRAFTRPSVLREHLKRHAGDKPYRCSDQHCGKAFVKKAALVMHERIHTGERPFLCGEPGCGKAFARRGHLKDHQVVHSGRKPFPCGDPGCGRSFARKIQLRYHARTHTGEKPYRCPQPGCGRAYTQNKHLRYHLLRSSSHSGGDPV